MSDEKKTFEGVTGEILVTKTTDDGKPAMCFFFKCRDLEIRTYIGFGQEQTRDKAFENVNADFALDIEKATLAEYDEIIERVGGEPCTA